MSNCSRATVFLTVVGVLAAVASPCLAGDFVLQAGRVVTVSGEDFLDGGSVLVRGGRIAEVKAGYVNPWGAEVRPFKDHWLLPGFVESHSQGGLERGNETAPNTPFVSVLDGLDPLSPYFEDLLRDGVTTVLVIPGDQTLFGGQGLVLKPVGRTAEEMVVLRDAGLKVALTPRRGTSRMAQVAELRKALEGARRSEGDRVLSDPDSENHDPRREALVKLLGGGLPAVFACAEPVDVSNALSMMETFGIRGFLSLGPACHRAARLVAERRVPVLLPSDLAPLEVDPETGRQVRHRLALEFRDAGVEVVIHANEGAAWGERSLWYQAAIAVGQGLTRGEALRAVSTNPARLLGVEDRVGSIQSGRDANLVLWTGDPLDPASWVDHVYVEGEHAYDRAKDRKLARLVEGPEGAKDGDAR